VLGAADVLLAADSPERAEAERIGADGLRVLLLGRAEITAEQLGEVRPAALVVLEQRVRPEAAGTLAYFAEQDVEVKVISGDNALSVGAVAASLDLPRADAPVDARTLPEGREELADALEAATVFGRVTPAQKRDMVGALQSRGHTVAMTGDGVNDVLALKDADIGVAMGSGSPASRAVAQIVLLDNSFATLPYVVAEGRRVIGNIERVSNLFLTKTVYSVFLAISIGAIGVPFPFLPRHLTLIGALTIGIPAFFLALAPNTERARPGFVRRVLRLSVPAGIVTGLVTVVTYLLVRGDAGATEIQQSTAAVVALYVVATWVLVVVARPFAWWKAGMIAASIAAFCYALFLPIFFGQGFWQLDPGHTQTLLIGLAVAAVGVVGVEIAARVVYRRRHPADATAPPSVGWVGTLRRPEEHPP
jgi:cation-transporting ATPase E